MMMEREEREGIRAALGRVRPLLSPSSSPLLSSPLLSSPLCHHVLPLTSLSLSPLSPLSD